MKSWFSFNLILGLSILQVHAQPKDSDSLFFRKIFNEALLRGHSYARLGELCKKIGPRLSGSDQTEKGIAAAREHSP